MRSKDDYLPPSLQRQETKRAAIAEAEAHERSGTKPLARAVGKSKTRGEKRPFVPIPPTEHYFISDSTRSAINLGVWVARHQDDPAIQVCLSDVSASLPSN